MTTALYSARQFGLAYGTVHVSTNYSLNLITLRPFVISIIFHDVLVLGKQSLSQMALPGAKARRHHLHPKYSFSL